MFWGHPETMRLRQKPNSVIEINEYDKVVYMWYYNNQRVIKRVID